GHHFMGGIHAHESWGPYELATGLSVIGYNARHDGKRLSVHKLSTEMRILHYLLTYTLLPRGGNHAIIQHDDVLLMWAMLEGHKICWPFDADFQQPYNLGKYTESYQVIYHN
ncbi:hypothetical protein PIB30_114193, partial [Stylosanthes scabra]|nr:hypothetical protein [Stylosanthes scabra]